MVKSTGSQYEVQVGNEILKARLRGRLRLSHKGETNPVAVGDRVWLRRGTQTADATAPEAALERIEPRENRLVRRAAGRRVGLEQVLVANVDFAWAVQSTLLPKLNPGFVDRFLVMAQHEGIEAGLIVNKADLLTETIRDAVAFWTDLYSELGYPVRYTSTKEDTGIDELRRSLAGKTTVLSGPSGVGKSSLINAIDPRHRARVGDVSEKTRKGRHITSNATLYTLQDSGRLIDTPGLREYGVIDIEPWELGHYFVEFLPHLHSCHYPNCTHDHEPGCAVVDAMERGEISDVRWASYLSILGSIQKGDADVGR